MVQKTMPNAFKARQNTILAEAVYGGVSPTTGGPTGYVSTNQYHRARTWVPSHGHAADRQRDRLGENGRTSLPPAKQNGLVASRDHFTEYKQVGQNMVAVGSDDANIRHSRPHYQSLPNSSSNNKLAEDSHRQTNSAPQRQGNLRRQDAPRQLPKINNLVKGHKGEPLQSVPPAPFNNYRTGADPYGKSTKSVEVKNLKSNKFASSWADARAGRLTSDQSPSRGRSESPREIPSKSPSNRSPTRSPARSPAVKTSGNGRISNSKSPAKSPNTHSPSVDSIRREATNRRVKEKKVVQGKPKIDTKSIRPMRKQTVMHMEVQSPENTGGENIKRNKTMYMEKDSDDNNNNKLPQEEQDKLQKTVYGVSQVKKIYNTKTTLSRKDLESRNQMNQSQMDRYSNPYLQQKVKTTPPWRRGEYILSKSETRAYKSMSKVYDNKIYKKQRQERFYKRLGDVQVDEVKRYNENAKEAMLRKIQTKIQQQMQLQRVRERFEEEQSRRFRTQYVTIRNLKHEYEDRKVYGLPDDLSKGVEYRAKLKRKKPPIRTFEVYNEDDVREKNRRKYEKIFDVKTGPQLIDPNAKPPKMEGIDTVEIEDPEDEFSGGRRTGAKTSVADKSERPSRMASQAQGKIEKKRPKKAEVKDVLADAKKVLEDNEDVSPRSPRKSKADTTAPSGGKTTSTNAVKKAPSPGLPKKEELAKLDDDLDSLDLDDDDDDDNDDDIFEKARRKYNINLDSDDDD